MDRFVKHRFIDYQPSQSSVPIHYHKHVLSYQPLRRDFIITLTHITRNSLTKQHTGSIGQGLPTDSRQQDNNESAAALDTKWADEGKCHSQFKKDSRRKGTSDCKYFLQTTLAIIRYTPAMLTPDCRPLLKSIITHATMATRCWMRFANERLRTHRRCMLPAPIAAHGSRQGWLVEHCHAPPLNCLLVYDDPKDWTQTLERKL